MIDWCRFRHISQFGLQLCHFLHDLTQQLQTHIASNTTELFFWQLSVPWMPPWSNHTRQAWDTDVSPWPFIPPFSLQALLTLHASWPNVSLLPLLPCLSLRSGSTQHVNTELHSASGVGQTLSLSLCRLLLGGAEGEEQAQKESKALDCHWHLSLYSTAQRSNCASSVTEVLVLPLYGHKL